MYRQYPPAVVAARRDEALTHAQVMFSLIKPTKDKEQVESTASMVNVVPLKRIYVLDSVLELDQFIGEMLKRPLVLQPSAYLGRGLAAINCSMCTREEPWLMLINQEHPKVREKLEMGASIAKGKMEHQEPFLLKISLNKYLKRIYLDRLTRTSVDPRFFFVEFEDAEIVIRYHGPQNEPHGYSFAAKETVLEIEDLLPSDVTRRTVDEANSEWANPDLRIVRAEQLSRYLPGWVFEQIDPLEGLREQEQEGATGGIEMQMQADAPPPSGRIVGRSRRKANSRVNQYETAVDLHVPDDGKPKTYDGQSSSELPTYQDVVRSMTDNYGNSANQYSPGSVSGQQTPQSPYTPQSTLSPPSSHTINTDRSPMSRTPNHTDSSMTRSPVMNGRVYSNVQRSPQPPSMQPSVPKSPRQHQNNGISNEVSRSYHNDSASPRTPTSPRYGAVNSYHADIGTNKDHLPSRQTYLTDDNVDNDDGGFAGHSPVSRSPPPHSHVLPNQTNGLDVRKNHGQYTPSNHHASPRTPRTPTSQRMVASPRERAGSSERPQEHWDQTHPARFPQSVRPVAAPRAGVHQLGSGRSDTTTDSGFIDTDNGHDSSKHQLMKDAMHLPVKTPYYNQAFQQDSPEKEREVDDIMARHRAMAAQMIHMKSHQSAGSPGDRQNDRNYGRELPSWRPNMSESGNVRETQEVRFSHEGNAEEQVSESFI